MPEQNASLPLQPRKSMLGPHLVHGHQLLTNWSWQSGNLLSYRRPPFIWDFCSRHFSSVRTCFGAMCPECAPRGPGAYPSEPTAYRPLQLDAV